MAEIRPFQALRYNSQLVSPSQVVTQPYDKITPATQERYYAASPYNLVRIILGRREPSDNTVENVYSRAAAFAHDWRERDILRRDSDPSIYACSQTFTSPTDGTKHERRGFVALGRVEDYSARVVFRHEQTLAKPKADRLDLLRATRTHFEQLFLLYEHSGEIDSLIAPKPGTPPTIDVTDEYGVENRVWQISDPAIVAAIQKAMADKKLVIADGHHRYETALNFRNENRGAADASVRGNATGTNPDVHDPDAPYEFVMLTFVNMNDPGLIVLPTHRIVHSLNSFSADEFQRAAREFFEIEVIDAALDAAQATELLRARGRTGTAFLAVTANRIYLLRSTKAPASKFFHGLSPQQQSLDVVQLHKCLLEGVLRLSEESIRNQENLSYLRDAAEAIAQVRKGEADIAFLMNPCPVQKVRDIAFAGEVMPQKSTDFYPKLLSGLTAYALD
ncbi:MAG TPA: DUF1015 domain-containing protein [Candidatus Sulfotelmatobacter sp.]|nr:DUF1015 domain-containing protein [Candidatus Sulfotelmatobacter sp.]